MNPRGQSVDNDLVNLGLIGIAALGCLAAALRLAGTVTAWATGADQPRYGWASGLRVLAEPERPGRALGAPGMSPLLYWLVVALMLAGVVCAVLVVWRRVSGWREHTTRDPRRLAGTATSRDVRVTASKKSLLARGRTLRPSLDHADAPDIGYLLGRARGTEVWASVEDSILLLGPPRSGKGLHIVINAILDAPGAVITTATRPDNIAATITARSRRGPVAVFDPQRLADGLPSGLRWSPVRGLRRPAHGNDPSNRPRVSHWLVDGRGRVGRILGGQDPHRAAVPAPRRSSRPA